MLPGLQAGSAYIFFSLQPQTIKVLVLFWSGGFAVDLRMYSQNSNSSEDLSSFSEFSVLNSIFSLQSLWISRTSKNAPIASNTVATYNQISYLYALLIFPSQKGIH